MVEREMDHTVGVRSRLAQPVKILKVTPPHRRAERAHGCRSSVGSGKTDDLVSCSDEFRDNRRAEMAGCAGDEYTHGGSIGVTREWQTSWRMKHR